MNLKEIKNLFAEAKKKYSSHSFFSVLIPVIAKTDIRRSGEIKTACISWEQGEPLLEFSPDFCSKYVKTPEDILFLLAHEVCHFVLGHLYSPMEAYNVAYGRERTNLALDIIIDQMLYRHFGESAGSLKIIDFYKESRCPVRLLLPPSRLREEEFEKETCKEVFRQISSGERLTPYRLIQHIVSHDSFKYDEVICEYGWFFREGRRRNGGIGDDPRLERFAEWMMKSFDGGSYQPAIPRAKVPFKKRFPEVIREIAQDGGGKVEEQARGGGVLPYSGRRDFLALAINKPVVIYHANPMFETDKGIRVYVDVSGSMDEDMPKVFSALDMIRDFITFPLYAFSLEVHPVTRAQLAGRKIVSLGGTDFDCVAEHAIKHRHDKILLITDGDARIRSAYAKTLKQNHRVVTVLSRRGRERVVKGFSSDVLRLE